MNKNSISAWLSLIFIYLFIATGCGSNETKTGDTTHTSASNDELFKKYNLDKIKLPPGFTISVFAEVPNARSLCWGDKGTLFVGNRAEDNVYAVVDENNDGVAEKVYTIATKLNSPNGVAFKDGSLYIAEINRILRIDNIEASLSNPAKPVVVSDKFPDKKHHGWKFIAFGPDGKLYVPVGAPCNICEEKDSIFATITRMNADGSGLEIYSKGVRNSVGFSWHPQTKEMWFTDNGRDELGDNLPGDELNFAPNKGMHFGFPYCHQGNTPDPEFGKGKSCDQFTPPTKILDPHVAALGMRFYTGNNFSSEYKDQIFIAEHGSWNRSTPIGYRISVANLQGNNVTNYSVFAEGWLQPGGKVLGRPVDVIVAKDGTLLVSDDYAGAIYRITYSQP